MKTTRHSKNDCLEDYQNTLKGTYVTQPEENDESFNKETETKTLELILHGVTPGEV